MSSAYYGQGTDLYGHLGRSEFLLLPDSTGHIIMIYDFNYYNGEQCKYRTIYSSSDTNSSPQDIMKNYVQNALIYKENDNQFVPLSLANKNIILDPQISNINGTTIEVNYKIIVNSSATDSSYFLKIPGDHPEIIITMGDKLMGNLLPNEIVTGQNTPGFSSNR